MSDNPPTDEPDPADMTWNTTPPEMTVLSWWTYEDGTFREVAAPVIDEP